jgi:glutamyl-Q tRNA(Asp) synthetase
VGSYLDARHQRGRWLLRMEDLDAPREVPGAATAILHTLEAFGLEWDGPVAYQRANSERYAAALAALARAGRTYECSCSRGQRRGEEERGYPGTCRGGPTRPGPTATRFRIDDSATVVLADRIQGSCSYPLARLGDVVIRRRDGIIAYQLAVVSDDAAQGVTDVIRGCDLLDSTPWQVQLQGALAVGTPRYGHLPLVVEPDGSKLAKSRRSVAVGLRDPAAALWQVLGLLRQRPPAELARERCPVILGWAAEHWRPERLGHLRTIAAP